MLSIASPLWFVPFYDLCALLVRLGTDIFLCLYRGIQLATSRFAMLRHGMQGCLQRQFQLLGYQPRHLLQPFNPLTASLERHRQ
jgi:hypothetical protein